MGTRSGPALKGFLVIKKKVWKETAEERIWREGEERISPSFGCFTK
jgi:hypothetical protein